ncbi:hypothetical protein EC957_003000 [Mortierella hygrophila]|uniref:F-box domain-containing protein n=1 Tax=Mortierella hygrophila TaxID=979708 RepID=A0A9P6K169_9FUNG|nr:hypothetical protein EC957_003000 [Mortierella hygrophila]
MKNETLSLSHQPSSTISISPFDFPEITISVSSYLCHHDLARCIQVYKSWYHTFLRSVWSPLPFLDINFSTEDAPWEAAYSSYGSGFEVSRSWSFGVTFGRVFLCAGIDPVKVFDVDAVEESEDEENDREQPVKDLPPVNMAAQFWGTVAGRGGGSESLRMLGLGRANNNQQQDQEPIYFLSIKTLYFVDISERYLHPTYRGSASYALTTHTTVQRVSVQNSKTYP